jgi:phosphoadenosine phosphosulfate reductase
MPAKTSAGRGATSASGAKSALRSPSKARDGAPGGDAPAQGRSSAAANDVAALDRRLAGIASLEDRLREIARSIKGRVTFSTSLGLEDQAILHAIATSGVPIDVFTLDTGRHFPETLETLEASEQRYGIKIRVTAPDAHEVEELVARDGIFGFRLAVENRKACCEVRKVRPLKRALAGASGWVTGLRRDQSAGRAAVPFAAWDADHSLVKVNPIADWTLEQLEVYIAEHKVPVNPLHAKGFPSIGCQPCTRAIKPGEDIRAGRWWWENEDGKECGLHNRPAQKEKAA